jgi:hypothetical protein
MDPVKLNFLALYLGDVDPLPRHECPFDQMIGHNFSIHRHKKENRSGAFPGI